MPVVQETLDKTVHLTQRQINYHQIHIILTGLVVRDQHKLESRLGSSGLYEACQGLP